MIQKGDVIDKMTDYCCVLFDFVTNVMDQSVQSSRMTQRLLKFFFYVLMTVHVSIHQSIYGVTAPSGPWLPS